jgi:small-conductance mechanosensitive channel
VRTALRLALPGESPAYRQFVATIILVFLWFRVALTILSIVGLDDIATSLGTATGLPALGVSYGLSGTVADAIAGVTLLRDLDLNSCDTVDIGGTAGTVKPFELRKTHLTVEDDTVVRANAGLEKK